MERVCEPELMDDRGQAQAYAAADFSAGDRAVLERLLTLFAGGLGASLLDLGCGPGNISFLLAEACPGARVLGVDGAQAMLEIAGARLGVAPDRWPGLGFACALLGPEGLRPEPAGRFTALRRRSTSKICGGPSVRRPPWPCAIAIWATPLRCCSTITWRRCRRLLPPQRCRPSCSKRGWRPTCRWPSAMTAIWKSGVACPDGRLAR